MGRGGVWAAFLIAASVAVAETIEPLSPPALGLIDQTFRADGALGEDPRLSAVMAGSDGVVVVQNSTRPVAGVSRVRVISLGDGGELAAEADLGAFELAAASRLLYVQPDGKLLVAAVTSDKAGNPENRLRRLLRGGARDATFAESPFSGYLVPRPGGSYAVITPPYAGMTVAGLTADGKEDPKYGGNFAIYGERPAEMRAVIDELGRITLAISHAVGPTYPTWQLLRLEADGRPDPSFAARTLPGFVADFSLTADGLMYVAELGRASPGPGTVTLGRLRRDGADDPGWPRHVVATPTQVASLAGAQRQDFRLTPEGGALRVTSSPKGRYRIERIDAQGRVDANFFAEIVVTTDAGPGTVRGWEPLVDGRIYAWGDFSRVNGELRRGIVRLKPDRRYAATRIANASVRAEWVPGAPSPVIGLTLRGIGQRTILARAVGPGLAGFGVLTPQADPSLAVRTSSAILATNDNWSDGPAADLNGTAAQVGAFPLIAGSKDAAVAVDLAVGGYSLVLESHDGAPGVVLGEWYDAGPGPADFVQARPVNFSVLGFTGSGERALTAGFAIVGTNTKRLLVRAAGPALGALGMAGALGNLGLEIYAGNERLATNDDWGGGEDLAKAFLTAGAFAWAVDSADAAILITLPPGAYSVRVPGVAGAAGIALVEIYELP